ncbi:MAG TPA: hypothetical protein VMF70_03310 [Gemmatimonadales bacterium]|nr:hypothetical protein [Gemmatimonadales bacterium]
MRPGKKIVACPQCSRRMTLQGLNGHLRFVHGVGADRVAATMLVGTVEDRAARVLELLRRFKEIRQQRDDLAKARKRPEAAREGPALRKQDAVHEAFGRAFDNLEAEILQQLRSLEVLDTVEK